MRGKSILRKFGTFVFLLALIGSGLFAFIQREHWIHYFEAETETAEAVEPSAPIEEPKVLKLSLQARKNLGLTAKPVKTKAYWRTIQIPGILVDRTGLSDRGITAPAAGVVTRISAFAGDTVKPGKVLITLRLFSEYLQNTQANLFKATREIQLAKEEHKRLATLAESGSIAGNRIIKLDQNIRRQEGLIQSYRQDLLTRGLISKQIEQIAQGKFVSQIEIKAPFKKKKPQTPSIQPASFQDARLTDELIYEVQELKVELGQQVEAGQLLAVLSNHRSLYIEGHAFKQESSLLEQVAQNSWPVQVEFADDDNQYWPTLDQKFEIRHLSNMIDSESRTFDFYIPVTNQSRTYEKNGQTYVVWRLRPGQRVRLQVPVEKMEKVIVLPADAVIKEGPEAYVFQQNGDLFNRLPVQIIHEDRLNVVLANDGRLTPGFYLAQSSAASLNRVLKAQAASGVRADVHVHADGTVHGSH